MTPSTPLPLYHSWPLFDRERRLGIEGLFNGCEQTLSRLASCQADTEMLASQGIGIWECTLAENSLIWSAGVYDLFGIPRSTAVNREDAVNRYSEESRAVMEWLRAYAIQHRRGFTVDVEIHPSPITRQRIRLSAVPVCEDGKVTRLQGVKQIIRQ